MGPDLTDSPENMFSLLLVVLAVTSAQDYNDWCIAPGTGMMACLAGTPMWNKAQEAMSQCRPAAANRRGGSPCSAASSAHASCVLGAMGYLSSDGTVNHSDIAADLGMLDPRVVEKFAAGKATGTDPTAYELCFGLASEHLTSCLEGRDCQLCRSWIGHGKRPMGRGGRDQ